MAGFNMADEAYLRHCPVCKKAIIKPVFYEGEVFCSEKCKNTFLKKKAA
jgi:predicted nucleic acid-binding Zn ribbon protein